MAVIQKCLGLGGACKIKRYFCHCCTLKSDKCADPNIGQDVCSLCNNKQVTNHTWKYYRRKISNDAQLQHNKAVLDDMKSAWEIDIEKVQKSAKLKLVGTQFKHSIDYLPADIEETMAFVQDLAHEMEIRNLETAGESVAQIMKEEIENNLLAKNQMTELMEFIDEESSRSDVMSRIMIYVRCILHAEN